MPEEDKPDVTKLEEFVDYWGYRGYLEIELVGGIRRKVHIVDYRVTTYGQPVYLESDTGRRYNGWNIISTMRIEE